MNEAYKGHVKLGMHGKNMVFRDRPNNSSRRYEAYVNRMG